MNGGTFSHNPRKRGKRHHHHHPLFAKQNKHSNSKPLFLLVCLRGLLVCLFACFLSCFVVVCLYHWAKKNLQTFNHYWVSLYFKSLLSNGSINIHESIIHVQQLCWPEPQRCSCYYVVMYSIPHQNGSSTFPYSCRTAMSRRLSLPYTFSIKSMALSYFSPATAYFFCRPYSLTTDQQGHENDENILMQYGRKPSDGRTLLCTTACNTKVIH